MTTDTGPETFEHNSSVPVDKIGAEALTRRVEVPPTSAQSWRVTKGDATYIVRGDTMTDAYDCAAVAAGRPVEEFLEGLPVFAEKVASQDPEASVHVSLNYED